MTKVEIDEQLLEEIASKTEVFIFELRTIKVYKILQMKSRLETEVEEIRYSDAEEK